MHYAAFGSIALGGGIVMYVLKKYGRLLNILFLLAGAALAPVLVTWIGPMLASVGGALFGIGAAIALASGGIFWIVIEHKGKGKHPKTPWIALLLPTLLLASQLPLFTKVYDMTDQVLQQGNTAVMQTGGGGTSGNGGTHKKTPKRTQLPTIRK